MAWSARPIASLWSPMDPTMPSPGTWRCVIWDPTILVSHYLFIYLIFGLIFIYMECNARLFGALYVEFCFSLHTLELYRFCQLVLYAWFVSCPGTWIIMEFVLCTVSCRNHFLLLYYTVSLCRGKVHFLMDKKLEVVTGWDASIND